MELLRSNLEYQRGLFGNNIKPSSDRRGFRAFSEFHLFDAWEKTGIADRRSGFRRTTSGSESGRTATGLDRARHWDSIVEWHRSRPTNPQVISEIQDTFCKPRVFRRCGAGSAWH